LGELSLMKKNHFLLALSFVLCVCVGTLYAQDKAEEAFLKGFPDLKVGKSIGEKECKNALKSQIKSETIGKIDYKKLLYDNATDISKWIIMPVGKYKVAESVYYLMYFSAYSGANHNDTDCSYMLNLALVDFNQDKRIGENLGNDGEYVLMSKARQKELEGTLGKNANITLKAGFTFTLDSPTNGTLKSAWEYSTEKTKKETYKLSWSSSSFEIK
jgi:hypothetical protein